MIIEDEDALICDFAETYRIYDYRSLPVELAATFAVGLGDDSRIKKKLRGETISTDLAIRALQLDALHLLVWMQSKDGKAGRNRPKSVFQILTEPKKTSEVVGFNSSEELMAEIERIKRS